MKCAIVCDWLTTYAGAERVLEQLIRIFPEADLFAVIDCLPDDQRDFIMNKHVNTTFLQHLPNISKWYQKYLPLMPLAIEQLDVTGYDLVISSSHCVAKGVLTGPNQVHISYVHSPMRYAWDLQHRYLRESNMTSGVKSWLARYILHKMRIWDTRTSNGVDHFIANSQFIARRIKKVYGREATVIYPPVDIDAFPLCTSKEDYYLTASRLVPYKKVKLIVEAFNQMPDKKLVVIGDGSEYAKIKAVAQGNIELMGYQPFEVLRDKMQHAKAFVFAAEEDFGITPVEAQACGTPVIAYGRGGALETITSETGVFFCEQNIDSIIKELDRFEDMKIKPEKCRANAERFTIESFHKVVKEFVMGKIAH